MEKRKTKKSSKKLWTIIGAIVGIIVLAIAAFLIYQNNFSEDAQYADKNYLKDMRKGLEARWDYIDSGKGDQVSQKEAYQKDVDLELEHIDKYTNESFRDSKLKQYALEYINAVKDQGEALEYPTGSEKFYKAWDKAKTERSKLIVLINDKYDLKISDKYKKWLDEARAEAKEAKEESDIKSKLEEQIQNAEVTKVDRGFGSFEYEVTLENTTKKTIKSCGINITFFDADGVVVGTTSDYTNDWKNGMKTKFTFYETEGAVKYELKLGDYYIED